MKHTDLLGFNQTVDIDSLIEEAHLLKEGSAQARELADRNSLEQLQDMYINCLVEETSMSKSQIKKMLEKKVNVYLTAQEAVELGIADIII